MNARLMESFDLISQNRYKLIAFNMQLTSNPDSEVVSMSDNVRSGIHFLLLSITNELAVVLDKLKGVAP